VFYADLSGGNERVSFMHSILFSNNSGLSLSEGKVLVTNQFDDLFLAHSTLPYCLKNSDALVKLNKTKEVMGSFSNSFISQSLSERENSVEGHSTLQLNYKMVVELTNKRDTESKLILANEVKGFVTQTNVHPKRSTSRTNGGFENYVKQEFEIDLSPNAKQTLEIEY